MWPGAAVSGYYLWNPASHYFGVGRIGRDQLADYAARKGVPLDEAERWLAPNLVDEEAERMSRDDAGRDVRGLPVAIRSQPPRPPRIARSRPANGVPHEIARHLIAVEHEVWWTRFASIADEDEPHWAWTEPGLAPGFEDAPPSTRSWPLRRGSC